MPRWTTTPENGETRQATRLLRCTPRAPIGGIITSFNLVGCYVHYWHGRTTPCEDATCKACSEHYVARWYGWVSLWAPKTNQHAIVEFTAACLPAFEEYRAAHGQLRGALLLLERANAKPNARLAATIKESSMTPDVLPRELDVQATMEKIWETHRGKPREPRIANTPDSPREKTA